jgi:FAD/FMN-containing dehydrogenase
MTSAELPPALLREFTAVLGSPHVLTGDATAGYVTDWTGGFTGHTPAVLRPRDTAGVAAVLALCTDAGVAVVPQGGNTGLVGGGVPRHGEVVLSLARLGQLGPVDADSGQVTAGAGVSLQRVADGAGPDLDLGILIASRGTATVGGAVATNAGGLRVLRYGPMRSQLRGAEAVLADGTVLSHLSGLVKDNTGYDYPGLLAGSEGTLAVITAARLQLVPRLPDPVTVIVGVAARPRPTRSRGVRCGQRAASFRRNTSPSLAWTSSPSMPGWPRRCARPALPTCCWRRPARARPTNWPRSPRTGPPRSAPARPSGPGCGPAGNGTRKRRVSSGCR